MHRAGSLSGLARCGGRACFGADGVGLDVHGEDGNAAHRRNDEYD